MLHSIWSLLYRTQFVHWLIQNTSEWQDKHNSIFFILIWRPNVIIASEFIKILLRHSKLKISWIQNNDISKCGFDTDLPFFLIKLTTYYSYVLSQWQLHQYKYYIYFLFMCNLLYVFPCDNKSVSHWIRFDFFFMFEK